MRGAAEPAYGQLLSFEIADGRNLRSRHQEIRIILDDSSNNFERRPADDSANAAGDRRDVINAAADERGNENVGSGPNEFNLELFGRIKTLFYSDIIRQLGQSGTGIA